MLPKLNRLAKKKDFDVVFKKGIGMKAGFLLFKVIKNQLSESRFGFIVSKKVSNKATIRNKVKRRLRSVVAGSLPECKKGVDVIITALSGIEKKEFSEIKEVVVKSLKKLL